MTGVDQIKVEAGVHDFVERDPVDAARLHGDRRHTTLHEPIGEAMKIRSEAVKSPHRVPDHIQAGRRHSACCCPRRSLGRAFGRITASPGSADCRRRASSLRSLRFSGDGRDVLSGNHRKTSGTVRLSGCVQAGVNARFAVGPLTWSANQIQGLASRRPVTGRSPINWSTALCLSRYPDSWTISMTASAPVTFFAE